VVVERDRAALAALRANVAALGLDRAVRVVAGDVRTAAVADLGSPFDLVVADPPYDVPDSEVAGALAALADGGALAPGADVVVERRVTRPAGGAAASGQRTRDDGAGGAATGLWPAGFTELRQRRYGDTVLCYGRAP
jgi:16S rRNA (guanine966-N2)-methyltransferase